MTTKQEYTTWQKTRRLERHGFEADPQADRMAKSENPKHVAARYLCGLVLQEAGHDWAAEVPVSDSGDRVDVIDYGNADEDPLAIEFESQPTSTAREKKIRKYVREGPCRDVIFMDLRECPELVDEIPDWIHGQLAL